MIFSVPARDIALEPAPLAPAKIVEGSPQLSLAVLWESPDGRCRRGLWQITPGTLTDVESDEMFIVLAGRAMVEVLDGVDGAVTDVLQVVPGHIGLLAPGTRTRWTVYETLRTAYQVNL